MKRILLMGDPNVGKSVVFSRLTGVHVVASNYPGTTIEYTSGYMRLDGQKIEVVDVPGTYTLDPTNEAEKVATDMLKPDDIVINVVDSTNLERNLNLTLQLLERGNPVLVCLNMWDDAEHRGITIDSGKLEQIIRAPVVPTVAVSGWGIKALVSRIPDARPSEPRIMNQEKRWQEIGSIIRSVQITTRRHHTFLEKLEDASIRPFSGAIIAALVLAGAFTLVRLIGEAIIQYIMEPFFARVYSPLIMKLSSVIAEKQFLHDVLIGRLINGEVDFTQSFGFLSTGVFVPVGMVLPYVVTFYFVLGLLEDVGYLPRLAIFLDRIMHKMGLHGYAIIPTILGLGCNVPGILATRILEEKRQRFIAATIISIGVPCAALQAMIWGMLGPHGWEYVLLVYGILLVVWFLIGFGLNKMMRGFSPELFIEIPRYHVPKLPIVLKKLGMRVLGFLKEALPVVFVGILFVNILYTLGVMDAIARFTAPVVVKLLGLPEEAVTALVIGFLRKDVALGMLAPLSLDPGQLVVASVVLAMFFPCIASFIVLMRELGFLQMIKATLLMVVSAIVVGSLLNLAL
ncbi:MAG: ferrous iron transporter B [Spirochaetales bacterium]|nr:ferrous iron transporter B [Spirochaetales bacterium]